ncbi:DNA polymerase subunit Cdc27 [Chlamydoabsidia padenii]|nr:DNA polymerase subunit Cdc27 [Chlamydoabsidia padenii]
MDYKDYLDTTVLQEKTPVTYRSLARRLNIHVNTAKQALYQYSLGQRSVVVIYYLSGTLVDNSFAIRLVNQDDLEETKKLYRQLSGVHVYSLLPCKPKDLSVLVTVHKDMVDATIEDRVKNGMISNDSISIVKSGTKTVTTTTTTPAPKAPSITSSASIKDISSKSNITKKPTPSTATTQIPAKRKGTLSFEKATPKKKVAVEKKRSPSPSPSRKVKSIQISDDEESEDEEALDARLARSAKIQVSDIFSDDDEDENMTNTSEQKPEDDDHSMKTASPSPDNIEYDDVKEDKEPEETTTPGKIRRKVQKKKTYRNDRGFLVTEDVWEWEEVDAEVSAPSKPEAPKAKPAPKKSSTTKKASGEQKSLLSFWGK